MIVCPQCAKENQDHYKFCLGCGSDLPRASASQSSLATTTPPAGVAAATMPPAEPSPAAAPAPSPAAAPAPSPAAAPAPSPAAAPAAATAPAPVVTAAPAPEATSETETPKGSKCPNPNCGADIPPGFAFCGSCGTPFGGAAPVSSPVQATTGAMLVLIQPDGSEGGMVEIPATDVAVGRDAGGFFATDAYLSPCHAVFRAENDTVLVRDADSLNGVYKKIMPNAPIEIKSGTIFRMGQEIVLFETIDKGAPGADGTKRMGSPLEGLWGRISLIVGKGRLGNAFPIGGEGIICGRERGNILFPEDGYISGVHLRIYSENGKFFITDLGSSNGSYVKLTGETPLKSGDFILMGAQLFRVQA